MKIAYRFYHEATLPDLQRLWAEATDWGEQTLKPLHQWFLAAPFGPPRIVVAVDEETDEIIGQFRFMPSRVSVNGREVRAVRPFGTIVSPKLRASISSPNPFEQPAAAMYGRAVKELRAMGEQLIYMVPDPRWVRLFQMMPALQCGSFPLWSLPVPLSSPIQLSEVYTVRSLESWDESVDQLWEATARLYYCAVVRNAHTLSWRLAIAQHDVIIVERDGVPVGLVVSRAKGDRQWLICDLLAVDDDALHVALAAACNVAHSKSLAEDSAERIRKVAVLATSRMEPAARRLGFARDNYDFPLAVQVLDPTIAHEDVAPARWYVSAND